MAYDTRAKIQMLGLLIITAILVIIKFSNTKTEGNGLLEIAGYISLILGVFLLIADILLGNRQIRYRFSRVIAIIIYITMIVFSIVLLYKPAFTFISGMSRDIMTTLIIIYLACLVITAIAIRVNKRQAMSRELFRKGYFR